MANATNTNTQTGALATTTNTDNTGNTGNSGALANVLVPSIAWQTKKGADKAAYTQVGAQFAPRDVRVSAAMLRDIAQWQNGQYRPICAQVRAMLSANQLVSLMNSVNVTPVGKSDTVAFLSAAVVLLGQKPDGSALPKVPAAKAAMITTLNQCIALAGGADKGTEKAPEAPVGAAANTGAGSQGGADGTAPSDADKVAEVS